MNKKWKRTSFDTIRCADMKGCISRATSYSMCFSSFWKAVGLKIVALLLIETKIHIVVSLITKQYINHMLESLTLALKSQSFECPLRADFVHIGQKIAWQVDIANVPMTTWTWTGLYPQDSCTLSELGHTLAHLAQIEVTVGKKHRGMSVWEEGGCSTDRGSCSLELMSAMCFSLKSHGNGPSPPWITHLLKPMAPALLKLCEALLLFSAILMIFASAELPQFVVAGRDTALLFIRPG